MMHSRNLQARIIQVTEGSVCIRLRGATNSSATAEFDVRVPIAKLMRVEAFGEVVVDEQWAMDFVGPNVLRQELIEETKPSASATLERARAAVRKLQGRYHPDVSRAAFFSAVEVSADLNALADVLRMIHSSKEN